MYLNDTLLIFKHTYIYHIYIYILLHTLSLSNWAPRREQHLFSSLWMFPICQWLASAQVQAWRGTILQWCTLRVKEQGRSNEEYAAIEIPKYVPQQSNHPKDIGKKGKHITSKIRLNHDGTPVLIIHQYKPLDHRTAYLAVVVMKHWCSMIDDWVWEKHYLYRLYVQHRYDIYYLLSSN